MKRRGSSWWGSAVDESPAIRGCGSGAGGTAVRCLLPRMAGCPRTAGRSTLRSCSRNRRNRRNRLTRRKAWLIGILAGLLVLCGAGGAIGAYYVDTVPPPDELVLPESTTLYYADGKTPMAKLGTENRTILPYDQIND